MGTDFSRFTGEKGRGNELAQKAEVTSGARRSCFGRETRRSKSP